MSLDAESVFTERNLHEVIASEEPSPDQLCIQGEMSISVEQALSKLDESEKKIAEAIMNGTIVDFQDPKIISVIAKLRQSLE